MATIRSDFSFLADNGLKPDIVDPVGLEDTSSKPAIESTIIIDTARLASSAWAGWQGACTSFVTAACVLKLCCSSFFGYEEEKLVGTLALGYGIVRAVGAYNNYIRPENVDYQPDSLKEESSKPTTEKKTGIDWKESIGRLTDSAWVGLRTSCSVGLVAALVSNFFRFEVSPILPLLCGGLGIKAGLANFAHKRPENLTEQLSESRIQTAVKSVFKGFVDGSTLLIPGLFLLQKLQQCQGYPPLSYQANSCIRNAVELTYVSAAVFAVGSLVSNILNRSQQESAPGQPVSKLGRLKNVCQIIGSAALSATAPIGVLIPSIFTIDSSGVGASTLPLFVGISSIAGLAGALESYYSNRKGINPELRIRKRFLDAFSGAWKTYSVATMALLFGSNISKFPLPSFSEAQKQQLLVTSAAILGVAQGAWSFFQKPRDPSEDGVLSTIYQKWKRASKVKKLGIALTSLAALSVVYLGGPHKAYEFGSDQCRAVNEVALKAYQVLAYNEKSIQSTYGEFLNGLPSKELEMDRLAKLATTVACHDEDDIECQEQKLEDFSCAQILQTCHLDAMAIRDHKKVYRAKAQKIHPDKNPNEAELSELASQALSYAYNQIRETKKCSGQDEEGCTLPLTQLTRTLRAPKMLFKKLFGLNSSTCTYTMNGKATEMPLEACQGL
ncbi:MAG: hypothetical protein S4CHLAM6_02650 [Chlamydiae bacterium]|nr:hypothetical protein [Chlamydiota bacterium]